MSFEETLALRAEAVQACLAAELDRLNDAPVVAAMKYATQGGKGLRGFLVVETAALFDVPQAQSLRAAAAIEAMHAYSLIHDDLPCMDDDDLRRGRPTVHRAWDEATAVLAGDALQAFSYEILADPATHPVAGVRVELVRTLAHAAGSAGMVLGQAQDIAAETSPEPLSLEGITTLQANKTGALFQWSAEAGARLGESDPTPLSAYAKALGQAFQIADDILDVEGDPDATGKRLNKDADAGKATFVSLLGLEGAKSLAARLVDEANTELAPFGVQADALRAAAQFAISRTS